MKKIIRWKSHEIEAKEYYTTINIMKEENVNIETAQKVVNALRRVSEIKTVQLNNGNNITVRCKLNEWGSNYNQKIHDGFRNNVRNTIAELMERAGLKDYTLSLYRYESYSFEITDEFHEAIKSI
jgi:molybdopterin converting factor small subunit